MNIRVGERWLHPRWFWVFIWLLLERQTEDVQEPDTKGPPSYKYGKVSGLTPDIPVMTETTENPYVCCGYCAAGMACRTAKSGLSGAMNSTAHPIRAKGGRPHNAGNNASELRVGSKAAHGVVLKAIAVSEIRPRLRLGYAVTAALNYGDLPAYVKVQGGNFGHAVMLRGIKGKGPDEFVGFFDALYPQNAAGAWVRWTDLDNSLFGDGNHSTTVVKRDAPTPPTPVPPKPTPPPDTTGPELPHPAAEVCDVTGAVNEAITETANAVRLDRDRAWRELTGMNQPTRWEGAWTPVSDAKGPGRWSRWFRFGPVPESGWNSGAAWGQAKWE